MKKLTLTNEIKTVISYFSILILSGLLVISMLFGVVKSNNLKGGSSTKIGSQSTFKRSQALATMKGYFTDKNHDVLVGLISIKDNSSSPLPFRASDYLVTHNGKGVLNAFFGRYSTDGDLYIIIPYPKENETYKIQITNRNYLGDITDKDSENLVSLVGSLSNQLSNIQEMGNDVGSIDSDKESQTDSIMFSMTIKPKLETEDFKVKTIATKNGTLLKKDKKGLLEFDFETFWITQYKEPLIKSAERSIKNSIKKSTQAQSKYNQYKEALNRNENDSNAKEQLSKYQTIISQEQEKQKDYSEKLDSYRELEYNSQDFSDYSTIISGLER